jgi:hypothetical protein
MFSLIAWAVMTVVSVVASGPPIRRSRSPLNVTLRSVGPPSASMTSRAYMEAALHELRAAHQDLAEAREELRREREEVKRLKQVEQKGAADEAYAPIPLTTADVTSSSAC